MTPRHRRNPFAGTLRHPRNPPAAVVAPLVEDLRAAGLLPGTGHSVDASSAAAARADGEAGVLTPSASPPDSEGDGGGS